MVLFALVALVFAEETKTEKKVEATKKDKRGLYGALGYGGLGYGLSGFNAYSSLPVDFSPSISTVLTKEVAVPVPQPVAVPVEKHVPVPVKVPILVVRSLALDYTCKIRENLSVTCT